MTLRGDTNLHPVLAEHRDVDRGIDAGFEPVASNGVVGDRRGRCLVGEPDDGGERARIGDPLVLLGLEIPDAEIDPDGGDREQRKQEQRQHGQRVAAFALMLDGLSLDRQAIGRLILGGAGVGHGSNLGSMRITVVSPMTESAMNGATLVWRISTRTPIQSVPTPWSVSRPSGHQNRSMSR